MGMTFTPVGSGTETQKTASPRGLNFTAVGGDKSFDIKTAQGSFRALRAGLLKREEDGRLGPEGRNVLDLVNSRAVVEGGLGAFVQGLAMNGSDEAIAGITSALGGGDELVKAINQFRSEQKLPALSRYDANLARERVGLKDYAKENLGKDLLYGTLGALVPMLYPPLAKAKLLGQMGIGAGAGGLSGFLNAEGGFQNRLDAAKAPAIISGALPVPLAGAGKVLGAGYRALTKPSVSKMGLSQGDDAVRQAIVDDVGSLDEATKILREARQAGKPMALADLGDNTRGVFDAAHLLPGEGKRKISGFLRDRDDGILSRMTSDLKLAFGKRGRFFDEFKSMKDARAIKGGKIYDRANKKIIPMTRELTELFQTPSMRNAIEKAREIAGDNQVKLPDLSIDDAGRLVDASGDLVSGVQTQFLHYIKMGLDDVVFSAVPSAGIGQAQKGASQGVRHKLLDIMDANNTTYKVARNYWAGETASMNAMQLGRKFLTDDIDELGAAVANMGKGELDAFRIGAMQGLMDNIERQISTGSVANNVLKTQRNRSLIRQTFPKTEAGTTAYNRFLNNLGREIDMKRTSAQVLGNSATMARKEAVDNLRAGATRALPPTSITEAVMGLLRKNVAQLSDEQLRAATSRIADLMSDGGEEATARIMRELGDPSRAKKLVEFLKVAPPLVAKGVTNPVTMGNIVGSNTPSMNLLDF